MKNRNWSKDEWKLLYYELYKNNFKGLTSTQVQKLSETLKIYLTVTSGIEPGIDERNNSGINLQAFNFLKFYKTLDFAQVNLGKAAMLICETYRNNFNSLEKEVRRINFQINYAYYTGLPFNSFSVLVKEISALNLDQKRLTLLLKKNIYYIFEVFELNNINIDDRNMINSGLKNLNNSFEIGLNIHSKKIIESFTQQNFETSNVQLTEKFPQIEKFVSSKLTECDLDYIVSDKLINNGFKYIYEVCQSNLSDLLRIPRLGRQSLNKFESFLKENDTSFNMNKLGEFINHENINKIREKYIYREIKKIAVIYSDSPNLNFDNIESRSDKKYRLDVWRGGKRFDRTNKYQITYNIKDSMGGGIGAMYEGKLYKIQKIL